MPDHRPPSGSATPPDWHHAFAALPLEAPPSDRWRQVAATLPRTPRRRRHLLPWAVAAATACLAAVPAMHLLRTPEPGGIAPPVPAAAVQAAPEPDRLSPSTATPTRIDNRTPETAAAAAQAQPASTAGATEPGLEPLQAESARLESLLAELSGTDAGGGVQLALSASLRTRVAGIDDALAGTGLDAAARSNLWQERVELLRALAGLAADQRWQALYGGNGADYALVQVH